MRLHLFLLGAFALAGCQVSINEDEKNASGGNVAAAAQPESKVAPRGFQDVPQTGATFDAGSILQAQVALDRVGFSSGVIDGKEGHNFQTALRGFQQQQGLPVTGTLDESTRSRLNALLNGPATRLVRIPASFAAGPFAPNLPKDPGEQAKLSSLGYRNLEEALAERFHTTPEALAALNPSQTRLGAGQTIRVPNIPESPPLDPAKDERGWGGTLESLGVAASQPAAERVVVDKSEGVLQAFDAGGKLIAQFPATMGSQHDPLPIGTWKIQGVSRNPDFHYNPDLFWDADPDNKAALLKPGPNGPVGVVWVDLSKPHYGIHGTSEPQTIGRAESHGCVRLTNWDAARLAQMVKVGTPAIFQK